MKPYLWFVCGAVLAALGVANGAFAAHGLEARLLSLYDDHSLVPARLAQYETGVRYQMYHALGLVVVGLAAARKNSPLWMLAGFCFLLGIIVFSGLLYLLVVTNNTQLGRIVPIGGVAFIVGWLALAAGAPSGFAPSPAGAERASPSPSRPSDDA